MQDATGTHIWLRYARQYATKDNQPYTLEMSIPVPVGATSEQREQLMREAEESLAQLMKRVEQSPSLQGRVAVSGHQEGISSFNASASTMAGALPHVAPQPPVNTRPTPNQPVSRAQIRPASTPAPQTGPQPATLRYSANEQISTDGAGNTLQLPQFIQYINENLNLKPRQAMEMLGVRSLTTGINLRDALEQLKRMVNAGNQGTGPMQQVRENAPVVPTRQSGERTQPESTVQNYAENNKASEHATNRPQHEPDNSDNGAIHHSGEFAAAFDEEVGPDEFEPASVTHDSGSLEGFDDQDFSLEQREQARARISELREVQGTATVNPARLKQAFQNVVTSQVPTEELLELIHGVWGVSVLNKLKVEQAEFLISWAKLEDDFPAQVDAVLAVLKEE